jgi:monoamine oxidase
VANQGCRTLALVSALTRRRLLYRAGTAAAVALAADGGIAAAARGASTVLVIGGGLAGLSATRSLRHRGHRVRLFEASDRLGGRVWTLRGFLAGGQVSEHGGEFISSEHSAMRGLADRLGLRLENTLRYPPATRDRYFFNGGRYPLAAAEADWAEVFPILRAAVHAAGYPTTFDRHTAAGRALDRMTVEEWIERSLPGGLGSRLGALVANSCVASTALISTARARSTSSTCSAQVRRLRGRARGHRPLRRRAHVAQFPGLHGGRRPQRPPRGPRDRLTGPRPATGRRGTRPRRCSRRRQ